MVDEPVEERLVLRVGIRHVARDVAPERRLVGGMGHAGEIEQNPIADGQSPLGRMAVMNMPDGILELLGGRFGRKLFQEGQIIVDRPRDDVEIEPLGRARLLIHEQREALRRRIFQPFVDAEPVALGL